jgi:tetratricopeptide (TPR) repeat protein
VEGLGGSLRARDRGRRPPAGTKSAGGRDASKKREKARRQERAFAPEADRPSERSERLWLLAVFGFALLLRLIVLHSLLALPLHRTPQLDSLEYLLRAERMRQGDFSPSSAPAHGPGYPFLVAGALYLSGGSLAALGVAQCLIGAALCTLVAALGRRWFGTPAGVLAGLLLAVDGPVILVGTTILAEGLLLFLMVLALWLFESRPLSARWAAATGAVIGLAALVRPTALVLLPVLGLLAIRRCRSAAEGRKIAAVLVAVAAATIFPVVLANWRKTHSLFLIQGNGGLSFYLGNAPSGRGVASGRFGGSWDAIAGEALRHGMARPGDQDRYYTAKALNEIRERPWDYVKLLTRKLLLTFQAEEVRDSHSYYFYVDRLPVLRWLPGFGLLFAFAVCGVVAAARSRGVPAPALGYLAAFATTSVLLVVGTRYRMPLFPVVAILAGLGAWRLIDAARRRRTREAAGLAAVLLVAWAFTHALREPEGHRFAEEWFFTGGSLEREGNVPGAETAYRRALGEDPAFAPALTALGGLAWNRGDLESAERDFEAALAADPNHANSHYWTGLVFEKKKRLPEAVRELRRARDLRADDPSTLQALARVLSESGLWDEAAAAYRALLTLRPGDPAAHLGLARVEAASHHLEAALAEAARATELDPENADAWLLRAVLAIDSKNPPEAEEALKRAQALAPRDHPPIGLAWALLERLRGQPDAAEARLKALLAEHPDFLPAVQLFLQNASEQGRRAQAEAYLRTIPRGGTAQAAPK